MAGERKKQAPKIKDQAPKINVLFQRPRLTRGNKERRIREMKTISTSKKTIAILLAILMVAAVSTISAFATSTNPDYTQTNYIYMAASLNVPAPSHAQSAIVGYDRSNSNVILYTEKITWGDRDGYISSIVLVENGLSVLNVNSSDYSGMATIPATANTFIPVYSMTITFLDGQEPSHMPLSNVYLYFNN
jgi:hypothetical protein